MELKSEPRYWHVFASNKSPFLGDLMEWAAAPKYGGETELEPIVKNSNENEK